MLHLPKGSIRPLLIGWISFTLFALVQTIIIVGQDPLAPFLQVFPSTLLSSYLYGAVGIGIWLLTKRIVAHRPPAIQTVGHLAGALLFAVTWYYLYLFLFLLIWGEVILELAEIDQYGTWMMVTAALVYGVFAGVLSIRHYRQQLFLKELNEKELLLRTSRMELAVLKSQMHPHFLFNTLNTVSALIGSDPERARTVIAELADILRYSLDSDRRPLVPLDDELRFVDHYLSIERERYGSRIGTAIDVDADTLGLLVPPVLLQPLVENAVRHGITLSASGGTIRIAIRRSHDALHIEVADDGAGAAGRTPEELLASGHGLYNTDQRLRKMFGDASGLVVRPEARSFSVSFSLPLIEGGPVTSIFPLHDEASSTVDR